MKIPTATFHGKVMVAVEDLKRAKNPRHPGRPRKPAPPTTPAN